MQKRIKSIIVFLLIVLIIALIYHPSLGGQVYITEKGHALYNLTPGNSTESFSATTILNNGSGYLSLRVSVGRITKIPCGNSSALGIIMSLNATGHMPHGLVPEDVVFAVRGSGNRTMYYSFLMKNNSGFNVTPWPQEASLGSPDAWSPKSIYDGFKPQASHFVAVTELLWIIKNLGQGGIIRITVRLYGFKNLITSEVDIEI